MSALIPDFLDQQDKLSRILGDSDTEADSLWPLADRQYEINAGELQFSIDSKSYFARTDGTVSSQSITLPTGYLGTHVLIVDGVVLSNDFEVPLSDWERYNDSGDDRFYFWVNTSGTRQINFFDSATNGLSYKFFYFRKPTVVLSADGDLSPFQNQYKMSSVFFAASQLLPMGGKTQLAAYYENEYNKLVVRAKDEADSLVKSVVKAMPDIFAESVFDQDKQGVGSYPGPGFNF